MNEHKQIERLMLFVELAEKLNYTRAAQELGISKGYLSEQIKRLEKELKCPLLIRTTRSVRLTREGERAYAQGQTIRAQVSELQKSINSEHTRISGMLRLTAPRMFSETYLADICRAFKQQHPDIEFEINSSYTTYNLNQQDIDLAFRATLSPPENMVAVKLFDYQHILVAAPEYLDNYGRPEHVDDLDQHQCLTTQHLNHWPLLSADTPVSGWMTTNDNSVLRSHAVNGSGIIRIADYYVKNELKEGALLEVLSHEAIANNNSIYLFYPQVIYPSLKLKTFVDFVQEYFRTNQS